MSRTASQRRPPAPLRFRDPTRYARFSTPMAWAAMAAATLIFTKPLLGSGPIPWGMDLSFAAQMAHGMINGLGEGLLYPRWIDETSRGFGAPALIFYPPLTYYAVAAVWSVTGEIVEAIRFVAIASVFLSALTFYLSTPLACARLGATVGAMVYVLLPYRAVDLFDRFAFAELAAFVWLPLVFRFVRDLVEHPSRRAMIGLAVSYAGLVLTHIVTAYMTLLVLGPYALALMARTKHWRRLIPMAGAGLIALLCCAVYLVPMAAQRTYANTQYLAESTYGQWPRNFAFHNETQHGYDRSAIKPAINRSVATQAVLAALAAGVLALRLSRHPNRRVKHTGREETGDIHWEGWTWTGLSAWTVLLQLPLSTPVWRLIPELEMVQFPWRFGTLQALSTASLVAIALAPAASTPGSPRWLDSLRRRPMLLLPVIALASVPALRLSYDLVDTRQYLFDEKTAVSSWVQSKTFPEYMPRGVHAKTWKELTRSRRPDQHAWLVEAGQLYRQVWTTTVRSFRIQTAEPNLLHLATFHYPGWQAWIDGQPAEIIASQPLGNISIALPAGTHEVEVVFTATRDRTIGAVLSCVGVLFLVGALAMEASERLRRGRGP